MYAAVAIWGFIDDPILGLVVVDTADNWLHAAIAGAGILAAMASSPARGRRAQSA